MTRAIESTNAVDEVRAINLVKVLEITSEMLPLDVRRMSCARVPERAEVTADADASETSSVSVLEMELATVAGEVR